jgi:hypothetical protein
LLKSTTIEDCGGRVGELRGVIAILSSEHAADCKVIAALILNLRFQFLYSYLLQNILHIIVIVT